MLEGNSSRILAPIPKMRLKKSGRQCLWYPLHKHHPPSHFCPLTNCYAISWEVHFLQKWTKFALNRRFRRFKCRFAQICHLPQNRPFGTITRIYKLPPCCPSLLSGLPNSAWTLTEKYSFCFAKRKIFLPALPRRNLPQLCTAKRHNPSRRVVTK